MSHWEQEFASQMQALCAQSANCFRQVAQEVLEPAFESVAEFVAQWKFQTSIVQTEPNRWSFKFALTENAYVLILFRFEGVDTLESEYEYWAPGAGRVPGIRTTGSLRMADEQWAVSCFQVALSSFVTKLAEAQKQQEAPEPVLV